jgi:glyoxylase-like metal-dependent hydrolase (beta-lactamase superfamily II)
MLGRGNSCNVFLIEQPGSKFLVDAGIGNGGAPQSLESALLKDGHSVMDIHAILVTLGHADHVDSISYFKRKNPSIGVWCLDTESLFTILH